ncbi:signal transduction protein [Lentzea sp. NBRC 105346]|uniref:diguanylate cyclase domain-containing protein n=1 Tax=Lentzea sp. NBRC 105346 TaxID=3032205 RepID=UPI0024A5A47A|nr:diguanylate cyclase [Lentzea sp. NBRC 105346]GLZ30056.1 signal transduction protein [Lentzea sp. NBRC 105346]
MESLLDELVGAVLGDPATAHDLGGRLVELHCAGPAVLTPGLALLAKGLLALPELTAVPKVGEKVVLTMTAFAGGCAEAVRESTLEQQETMSRALMRALDDARQHLSTLKTQFEHVVTGTASGVALTDRQGRFQWTSERLGEILGFSAREFAEQTLFDVVHPDELPDLHESFAELEDRTQLIRTEHRLRRRDGENAWVSMSLSRSPDDRYITVVEDHTELNLLHGQLNHQALHDMLTRLPNRQYFTTRLERVLRHADPATGVTIYQLDLDAFSVITLGLGRRAGDVLLEAVADRLQRFFARPEAMVARFGADEFAVLVENSATTPDPVTTIHGVYDALAEPMPVDGQSVTVSASIGVVDRPPLEMPAAKLMEAADLTLARARRNGRAQWALFDPTQDAYDRSDFRLAASVPDAFERGQLTVGWREIRRLGNDEVIGLDAVLSWPHTDSAALTELAERTGAIMKLGRWLLREACTRGAPVPVHVGLSTNQSIDPDLVGAVLTILKDTGQPPERLWLTMPGAALRTDDAAENLRLLYDSGVRTAIRGTTSDDVACLESLPVRSVRIPQPAGEPGLVTRMLAELVTTAHLAGATVIVDGVASRTQATWWRSIGADASVSADRR